MHRLDERVEGIAEVLRRVVTDVLADRALVRRAEATGHVGQPHPRDAGHHEGEEDHRPLARAADGIIAYVGEPRTDRDVGALETVEDEPDVLGIVLAVGVDLDRTPIPAPIRKREAGAHGAADPEIEGQDENLGTRLLGGGGGPVDGSVINDDDVVHRIGRTDLSHGVPDVADLIPSRHEHGDAITQFGHNGPSLVGGCREPPGSVGPSPAASYTRGMLRRARAVWRHARSLPLLAPALREIDRLWWARTIAAADVVDLDYVHAQGGPRTRRAAIRYYTRTGHRTDFALNPLFMERLVSSQLPDAGRVPALYAYLVSDAEDIEVSVAWDAVGYGRRVPASRDVPGRSLGHGWRAARASGSIAVRSASGETATEWSTAHGQAVAAAAGRIDFDVPPLTTDVVVCRLAHDEGLPARPLEEAVRAADGLSAALVLAVATGSTEAATAAALLSAARAQTFLVRDDATLIERVENATAEGATLVVRGPHSEIPAHSLVRLAEAAAQGPVAPLWLGWDGAVASAGLGVHDGRPFHLLPGAPSEDALALGAEIVPWRVAGATFARRVGDASTRHRTLTDLVVRAPASDADLDVDASGAPDTDLRTLAARRGWKVSHWGPSGPSFVREPVSVTLTDGRRVPSWRWALKIAAPPGRPGEAWGDTHFARGLADALRRQGQEVVIDAYAARRRPTTYLDDVTVALRGPEPLEPQTDALSLLWVISHPDEITASDLDGFDAVFAASRSWAEETSAAWNRPITPLLQCTDPSRFRPQGTPRTNRFVFVGTARGIVRPSVVAPVRAGLPVDVYGPDWRGYIPSAAIRATGVPNSELPRLYEGARAVLNDHWPAMQRHGFVSNRLFDVVAAGGRAVSDDVAGIAELFQGAVATYRSVPEMLRLLEHDLDDVLPDDRSLEVIAAAVRRDHSFDARADTLLRTALELRR